jgi:hypothetical protein
MGRFPATASPYLQLSNFNNLTGLPSLLHRGLVGVSDQCRKEETCPAGHQTSPIYKPLECAGQLQKFLIPMPFWEWRQTTLSVVESYHLG